MKLILKGHDYRYGVEQTAITLFPEEGINPDSGNTATLSLSYGAQWVTASAVLDYQGNRYYGTTRIPVAKLIGEKLADDRILQKSLKNAFYKAGVQALPAPPPWGSITGVRPVKIPTKAVEQGATLLQAEDSLRKEYFISERRISLAMDCTKATITAKEGLKPDEISLYIGIPFCPTRCAYCSFVAADIGRILPLVEPFLQGLCEEIRGAGIALKESGKVVRTLYLGGGTPTTLSATQLARLLGAIMVHMDLSHLTEYTVEAGRPDTITKEKLEVLRAFGVDRISVNPQTMDDGVLKAMGRSHTVEDFYKAWELVQQVGFQSVNMDLIAGLPTDSYQGFCQSLDKVMALNPENITVHTLALKKGSTLKSEGGHFPNQQEVSAMLDYGFTQLHGGDYTPYYLYRQKYMSGSFENVGWAKEGHQSLYNLCMMEELHSVIALGGGGMTKLLGPQGRITRISNPKYPHDYLDRVPNLPEKWQQVQAFFNVSMNKEETKWYAHSVTRK